MPSLSEYYPTTDPALQPPAPTEQAAAPVPAEGSLATYYAEPAPQQAAATTPNPEGSLGNYYTQDSSGSYQFTPEAAPAQAAPEAPVDKGYVPGTNAVVDTAFNVGNAIGAGVDVVGNLTGHPELRDDLAGAAPPIKEIAEADGIKDKLLVGADLWNKMGVESDKRTGQEAIKRLDTGAPTQPSYNITSPDGLATAGSQFVNQLGDFKDHPEDVLYSFPEDIAESGAFSDQGVMDVLGQVKDDPTKVDDFLTGQLRPSDAAKATEQDEQTFYDWADTHPDVVAANRETPENLFSLYKDSIGASWEKEGLQGTAKSLLLDAGRDPSLLPSLGIGAVAGVAEKGLLAAGKIGAARGVSLTEKALNSALGGPTDVLVDKGVSTLGKLVPQPIKSLLSPSEEGQRVIGAQERREVLETVGRTRDDAGRPASRLGTPYQTTPFVESTFGGRKKPSTSAWTFDPTTGNITRDGNLPTVRDLDDVRSELLDLKPGEIYGFDDPALTGLPTIDPRVQRAVMRGALTQGQVRTVGGKTTKVPYMVDDFPTHFKGTANPAANRYAEFMAERIRRYGDDEVQHILQSLNNTKYRGKRGNTQPVEMWYDSMRQVVANALVKAKYSKPVDLGITHRFDPVTGTYKQYPKRLVVGVKNTGKPLNIDDFEPDAALWTKLQASAHPSSRITTPPPVRTAGLVNNAPPPPIQSVGWKLPGMRKKPTAWALSDLGDEFDGLALADGHIPYARQKVGDKTLFRTFTDEHDQVHHMLDIAQGRQMGAPGELDKLVKGYTADYHTLYGKDTEPDFLNMGEREATEFAATVTTQRWLDSLPPLQRKQSTGLLGGIKALSSDIGSFRSGMGLHNWAALPKQTVTQWTGNVFALLLTKPSAVTGMFNPKTAKAYFDAAREARKGLAPGQRVHSANIDAMHKMGLGTNTMVSDSGKNIVQRGKSIGTPGARDEGSILAGPMRGIKKILAPDITGDIVSIPDGMFRDAITADFAPAVRKLQKSYPKEAASLAQDWVRAKGLAVPPGEVNKVVDAAFKRHFDVDSRVSTINMTELEDSIFDAFKHLPDQDTTRTFANRVARDYKTKLNNQYQATAGEAKKIAFSWDYNRLDDMAKHVFLYHYWSSRATGLYAKQLIKNPWIAASYARLAIALNDESEQMEYSPWMQGFSRLLSSPGGSVLMASPLSLMGAMGIFADWQYGMEPERVGSDITMLGQARGIWPAMAHPGIDSLAWAFGLYGGEDAPTPMDPTGLERIPRDAIRLINLANLNGQLPDGMLRDANGNPVLLGEKPLSEIWQHVLSGVSGIVRDNPQPIKDLYASETSRTQAYLMQGLIEDHPDWGIDQVAGEAARIATEAETNVQADPRWNEAQLMRLQSDLRGPEFAGLPTDLQGLLGGFLRNVSPVQMVNRPELAMATRATPIPPLGREPMTLPKGDDQYDSFDLTGGIYDTPEMNSWDKLEEAWWPDPAVKDASTKRKAIVEATNPDGEVVNGVHYSQQQIMDMTNQRRYKLGEEAMNEMGVTEEQRLQTYDAQRVLEENNPQLQQFEGYKDAINNAPEGSQAYIDNLYKTEPAFARAMDRSGKEKGTEDWYGAATWPETFLAASGTRTSLYDAVDIPQGMDMSGYATQRADTQAAYEDNSFTAKTERSVNEFMLAQQLLDQAYPGYGYKVGSGSLPPDVWSNMKTIWTDNDITPTYLTKSSHYGAEYVQWVLNNPNLDDTSVRAFTNATSTDDGSNKFAEGTDPSVPASEQETFDLNGPVNMEKLGQMFGLPQKTTQPTGQLVFPNANVSLRQTPGGSQLTVLAPKTPLRLLERSGQWALVSGPGGWQGYVPITTLMTSAA